MSTALFPFSCLRWLYIDTFGLLITRLDSSVSGVKFNVVRGLSTMKRNGAEARKRHSQSKTNTRRDARSSILRNNAHAFSEPSLGHACTPEERKTQY